MGHAQVKSVIIQALYLACEHSLSLHMYIMCITCTCECKLNSCVSCIHCQHNILSACIVIDDNSLFGVCITHNLCYIVVPKSILVFVNYTVNCILGEMEPCTFYKSKKTSATAAVEIPLSYMYTSHFIADRLILPCNCH